ncbi:hypothetical protein GDO81_029538 [Engystomops pustulosus]|uniref:Zona pellucida sperm-binding protein 4 n=1 Tax=Engystomops pustulosus TaxID=76066 RepID=A0AAV6YWQ2_ENGPU|nr:hypothetical protein GDO81_029540 [Engystomops pustulosus]KAG8541181.1 hypothetical protein GDO81_029538 [Engystomops pustulosus]
MALCRSGLGFAGVLWMYGLVLVCAVQDYWDDPSHLHCGSEVMEFSLPSLLDDAVFALTIIDEDGKPHYLRNDSSCGTWIVVKDDGSLVVGSSFDGCYVREEDGNYTVTITLEEMLHDGKTQYHKKDLQCPILPAMDAPSPSECGAVPPPDRLSCADDSISRERCEGLGCCYSQSDFNVRCYYAKKLTAQCTADNNMVVAISKHLTIPDLVLSSAHMIGVDSDSCKDLRISSTESFIAFRFPLSCGGTKQAADLSVVYENTLEATQKVLTWQAVSITRDSTMRVTVHCSYARTGVAPLQVEVLTHAPPLPVSTSGPLTFEMRIAPDEQYDSYYTDQDYPILRVLRDPVHVEVRALQRTDPTLVLVLHDCWATNSPVPTDNPQWPVLNNGCPYEGDTYRTQQVPVDRSQSVPFPTHYKRFIVSAFTFVDFETQTALKGPIFFHCSASVCTPTSGVSCSVTCNQRQKRTAKARIGEDVLTTVSSHGPVIFYAQTEADKALNEEEGILDSGIILAGLQGAAVAGFIVMVSLLGIYLYKRQRKCAVSTISA